LLRNGGSSASAIAFQSVFASDLDLVPIESMVLVEARILCGDYSVLEIGRDLAKRNDPAPLAGLDSLYAVSRTLQIPLVPNYIERIMWSFVSPRALASRIGCDLEAVPA
jgi:hypothetical protein